MTHDAPADPVEVAREIALRRLSVRAHSRAELAQAMQARNVPDEVIEQVLDRFTEVDLIDDQAFADEWVRSRHEYRHLSRRVLADELRRKGVDAEVISDATASIDHDAELDAARAIARKKARSLASLDAQVARRRLMGALARRGYGSSVVTQVVTETLSAFDDDSAENPEFGA